MAYSIVKRTAQRAYVKMPAEERNSLMFADPIFQMLFKEFVVKALQLSKFKKKRGVAASDRET